MHWVTPPHLDLERVLGKFLEDHHGAKVDFDDPLLEELLHHVDHISRVTLCGYLSETLANRVRILLLLLGMYNG